MIVYRIIFTMALLACFVHYVDCMELNDNADSVGFVDQTQLNDDVNTLTFECDVSSKPITDYERTVNSRMQKIFAFDTARGLCTETLLGYTLTTASRLWFIRPGDYGLNTSSSLGYHNAADETHFLFQALRISCIHINAMKLLLGLGMDDMIGT